MAQPGSGKGRNTAAASEAAVRAWFDEHGWRLEPADLRAALEERGADEDVVVELIDEGADRRRAQPQPRREPGPGPRAKRPANGNLAAVPEPAAVPPQSLEAEESVLGALLLAGAYGSSGGHVIDAVANTGLRAAEFYRETHAKIYTTAIAMHGRGELVDPITVVDELERKGWLDEIGGRVRVHELAALVPAFQNAPHYARIVRENAAARAIIRFGGEAARLGWDRPGEAADLISRVKVLADELDKSLPPSAQYAQQLIPGGQFIFDRPDATTAVWGDSEHVAWAEGEGLMLVGPDGVGKTTLGQQVALARCGIHDQVLGFPVAPDPLRVLYLAADRPRQAERSLRRMVTETARTTLDERLVVWKGHLPFTLDQDPERLAQLIRQTGDIGTLIVDSLKDVALDLVKDDAGSRVNYALQAAIAEGVQVIVLHHQRKGTEGNRKPDKLADVYGSRWLTAGMGSVILLWGDAGDPVVEFKHLKQPIEELGPYNVHHDHVKGVSTLDAPPDLLEIVYRTGTSGTTALAAAGLIFSTDAPSRAQKAKAARRLERLADQGRIVRVPGLSGQPDRYLWNGGTG